MTQTATRKVTISLPQDLLGFADAMAAELKTTRSKVISDSLREMRQREQEVRHQEQARVLELNEKFHDLMIQGSRNRLLSKITSDVHVLSLCFSAHRGSPKIPLPRARR